MNVNLKSDWQVHACFRFDGNLFHILDTPRTVCISNSSRVLINIRKLCLSFSDDKTYRWVITIPISSRSRTYAARFLLVKKGKRKKEKCQFDRKKATKQIYANNRTPVHATHYAIPFLTRGCNRAELIITLRFQNAALPRPNHHNHQSPTPLQSNKGTPSTSPENAVVGRSNPPRNGSRVEREAFVSAFALQGRGKSEWAISQRLAGPA